MAPRTSPWAIVLTRHYWLRWGIPALVLLSIASFLWDRGWWVHVIRFTGMGLLLWPIPTAMRRDPVD